MNNGEFREWLRGFFELSEDDVSLNPRQVQIIVNHMNLAESVSGKLDELNGHLRAEIDMFRNTAPHDQNEFALLAQSLSRQVMQ